jgi:hypothetical protein
MRTRFDSSQHLLCDAELIQATPNDEGITDNLSASRMDYRRHLDADAGPDKER